MENKIRLGIIGFGGMGGQHGKRTIDGEFPDFKLTAIADTNPARLEYCKKTYPDENIALFSDGVEMLDSGLVDACIIATPHYYHPVYAIECIRRGIHVLSEKPAGVYTKNLHELIDVANEHPDVVFGLMFNQRTNCVYRRMREIIKSGRLGNIRRTNWIITDWYRPQAYYDSGEWRATWSGEGGGVLINQCPHQIDLWQWICGMPVKVDAHLHFGKWHDIEVEDDVSVYVEYENGATGVFIASTGDANGSNRFEIELDKGKMIVENNRLRVWEFAMSEQEYSAMHQNPFGNIDCKEIDPELDGKNPQHAGVINAWGGAILRGTPLVADGREGINELTLSNAIHLSGFLRKEVEIPFDEDLYYEELMKRVKTSRRKDPEKLAYAKGDGTFGVAKF